MTPKLDDVEPVTGLTTDELVTLPMEDVAEMVLLPLYWPGP